MLVFGEHARELISAESGLHLLRTLCGELVSAESGLYNLTGVEELRVVVNANPVSRHAVEGGEWCRRTNENGVDLNRNWGDHWSNLATRGVDTNPGSAAFSEPETRLLRGAAEDFKPHLFLTVHSGALLLGTPFGYQKSQAPSKDEARLLRVLRPISEKYCDCPFGSLAQLAGYKSQGNAIDYAYENLSVPFAFTWEIYTDPEQAEYYHRSGARQRGREKQMDALQHYHDKLASMGGPKEWPSVNLLAKGAPDGDAAKTPFDCLARFNPQTADVYNEVLAKWTSAYLDALVAVAGEVEAENARARDLSPFEDATAWREAENA